ncbi:hypothetical protein [Streptomyces hydrogenans]|uniref:hypothetical protein n=1 Tax=Streptomyces hydrogenans TaxID=1873719 RepID=UPI0035D602A8
MTLWVMALANKDPEQGAEYADDVSPVYARANVLVHDFADLLPVLARWRAKFGEEITAYVMSTLEVSPGVPAADTYEAWDRFGPEIRIDVLRGGYFKISDYRSSTWGPDGEEQPGFQNLGGLPIHEEIRG